jgi:HSP20 family protein
MSLSRNFFREFRPLFRMLEDPFFGRTPVAYADRGRSVFDDPFFGLARNGLRPAVDVAEEGNSYIIEAELPGVRKEDINVQIGDNGRSVTIEGKIVRRPRQQEPSTIETSANEGVQEGESPLKNNLIRTRLLTILSFPASPESTKVSVERESTGHTTFTRSITLPTQVDASKVSAKLADGVLTLTVPRAEDAGRVKIDIE